MPPNRTLTRLVFALAALSLAGCPGGSRNLRTDQVAADQWRAVEAEYPAFAAAYVESLIALTDDGPEGARARDAAFALAQRCGLLTVPRKRPDCGYCPQPASHPGYRACLVQRLNCLGPP